MACPPTESHSSGPEESIDEEVGSLSGSVASSSSGFSYEKETKAVDTLVHNLRTHLPLMAQKEMSKLFSARCDATQAELAPFKVVMDIIRDHFITCNKPELLRVLIRLLSQYQPLQGHKEYKKLISLCEDLLTTVDEEVRDAFLSMIPTPTDYRINLNPLSSGMGCGHFVRTPGRKDGEANPLAELVKRPLLSYQTMPAPLFQQPLLKFPPTHAHTKIQSNDIKDPYKYYNMTSNTVIQDLNKNEYAVNKNPAHSSLAQPPWLGSISAATTLPSATSNNNLMWFARPTQSPMHSPGRTSTRHSLVPPNISSLVSTQCNLSQHEVKKQQLMQRKQELIKNIECMSKMKNFENSVSSDGPLASQVCETALNSNLMPSSFPICCMNAPNYCGLRATSSNNVELSSNSCTITSDIAPCYMENRVEKDNSCYLERLLKRPETPDCNDPWGNGKKPRRQSKPCGINNNLMNRKKKKSKK